MSQLQQAITSTRMPLSAGTDHSEATYTSPACKRCHSRKRKCDRKHPRCSACAVANAVCEIEIKPGEKRLITQLNDLRQRNVTLEKRVGWLEQVIASSDPNLATISTISTGHPIAIHAHAQIANEQSLSPASAVDAPQSVSVPVPFRSGRSDISQSVTASFFKLCPAETSLSTDHDVSTAGPIFAPPAAWSSQSDVFELPPLESTTATCREFLSGHKQTHHLVDQNELSQDLQNIYQPGGMTDVRFYRSRFRCFTVLYLAQYRFWNGPIPNDQRNGPLEIYRRLALKNVGLAIEQEDLETVQALGLLALMSIQDPQGPDLWQLVGMAARTSIALGIHRKDSVYLASLSSTFTNEEAAKRHNIRRKNIFWAIYSLDRLVTFTLMRPAALRDDYIDVEMPSVPSPSSSMIRQVPGVALQNHSLQGRKLYGRIFHSLYAPSVSADDRPSEERETIIAKYTLEVQTWYASSPLKAAFMPMTEATVRRQSITDLQFHQMIMALHRPSPLVPRTPSPYIDVLYEAASISIDLYRHYSTQNQVLVNWIHFHQIFTSCTTLVFCFCEYQARQDLAALPSDQVLVRIDQCRELLAQFGPATLQTQNYQCMFDILAQPFSQVQPASSRNTDADLGPSDENSEDFVFQGDAVMQTNQLDSSASDAAFGDFFAGVSPSSVMHGFWADTWAIPGPR